MRLRISTPLAVVVDEPDVRHVRAEDASGAFGVRPGHADLVTVLEAGVLTWRGADGGERHVALRGGVLTVGGGDTVDVASREAVPGVDLDALLRDVRATGVAEAAARAAARAHVERMHVAALQRVCRYLRADLPEAPRVGGGRSR